MKRSEMVCGGCMYSDDDGTYNGIAMVECRKKRGSVRRSRGHWCGEGVWRDGGRNWYWLDFVEGEEEASSKMTWMSGGGVVSVSYTPEVGEGEDVYPPWDRIPPPGSVSSGGFEKSVVPPDWGK